MAECIAEYLRQAAYYRFLASTAGDAQVIADLEDLAKDCETEANKLRQAFG